MPDPHEKPAETGAARLNDAPLPAVRTGLGRDEILTRLEQAWRRGKLPGYAAKGPGLFRAEAFAAPFPSELIATAAETDRGVELRFETKMVWKLPVVFGVTLILTLQPGMWLTNSMLITYSDWYYANVETWWWYVPFWVLSLPWVWTSVKKSRAGAHAEADKAIRAIAKALDGELITPQDA